MIEARLPKVGDVWSFTSEGKTIEYYITFVDDEIVHLAEVETGEEAPAYPVAFLSPGGGWKFERESFEYFCSVCEETPHEPGDYLCHECRYGK